MINDPILVILICQAIMCIVVCFLIPHQLEKMHNDILNTRKQIKDLTKLTKENGPLVISKNSYPTTLLPKTGYHND